MMNPSNNDYWVTMTAATTMNNDSDNRDNANNSNNNYDHHIATVSRSRREIPSNHY